MVKVRDSYFSWGSLQPEGYSSRGPVNMLLQAHTLSSILGEGEVLFWPKWNTFDRDERNA